MPRKSLEQQIIDATKAKNWEQVESLTAELEKRQEVKKAKPKPKPRVKVEPEPVKQKVEAKPKPKLRKISSDQDKYGIKSSHNEDVVEKKAIKFFDDGSEKKDSKLDRKLQKGVNRSDRRGQVEKVLVNCNMCDREHMVYESTVKYVEGEVAPMICIKCAARGIR